LAAAMAVAVDNFCMKKFKILLEKFFIYWAF